MLSKPFLANLLVAALISLLSSDLPASTKGENVATWVETQVKALQSTPAEKRFDEVGWAKGIVQAEKLARQHNRPVFLFTYNGSIDTGRC
jgi:hypothetical protein